jgi:RNA polymerase sigma-70 factor (ECF subfamily)
MSSKRGWVAEETVTVTKADEATMVTLLDAARREHPGVDVPLAVFAQYVETRLDPTKERQAALDSIYATDLYLACACGSGTPAAIQRLHDLHEVELVAPLAQLGIQPCDRQDVLQQLRERLLVGRGGKAAAITQYNGRGPLSRWLRVTAMRTALNAARDQQAAISRAMADADRLGQVLGDPELEWFRERYEADFREALRQAVSDLRPRWRRLLRLAVADGLTVREIAAMYGIHFASAARTIRNARDKLAQRTHDHLKTRLELTTGELQSVVALIRSRLDLCLQRTLSTPDPEHP